MAALASTAAEAQTGDMQAHFGKQTFRLFCAGCHGADGRGNGELAQALGLPMNDLTQIARRNGGVFPTEEITRSLTGRGPRGHADLDMAPWADMFAAEFESFAARIAVNALVARRIDHLVSYLESIQD